MGAEQSIPEQLYAASKRDDVEWLRDALHRWQQQQRRVKCAAERHSVLSWQDPTSRLTPLMLIASKNQLEAGKALLEAGADPNFLSRAPVHGPRGGTALHDAVRCRHPSMVDLLLQHMADPFLENADGYTPMDVAVSEADPTILRCLESRALFAGYISQQLPHDHAHAPTGAASAGSGPFAVRWCVVAPRVTPPSPGQAAGTVRVELLVYDSFDAAQPKMRVWLTGAAASLTRARRASSLEGIVRLHPDHRQPTNAATSYCAGWLLTFRPPSNLPLGDATLSAFIDCCSRPLDYLAASAASGSAARGGNVAAAAAAACLWGLPFAAAASSAQGGTGQEAGAERSTSQQQLELHRQLQATQLMLSRLQLQLKHQQQQLLAQQAEGVSAAVLGRAFGAAAAAESLGNANRSGGPAAAAAHVPPPHATGRLSTSMQGQDVELIPAAAPPLSHIEPLSSIAVAVRHGGGAGESNAHPGFDQIVIPGAAAAATAGADETLLFPLTVSSSTLYSEIEAAVDYEDAPEAAAVAGAQLHAPCHAAASDADACVICLSNAKELGLLHREASVVHKCVCRECAALVRIGGPCPLCREAIAAILKVY